MKLRIRDSFIVRAIALTLILCLGFLFIGGEIARLLERVGRDDRRLHGLAAHASIIDELIHKHNIPPNEALGLVRRSLPPHFPMQYQIIDSKTKANYPSAKYDSIDLSQGLTLVVSDPHENGKRPGPPPRFMLIGFAVSLGSLVSALAISGLLMIWFLRRKAWEVGQVLAELEAGNLGARIPPQGIDELTGLTNKFNQMATSIQELVANLRQTEESRRLLLEELAHDLRTPVASLKSATEIIQLKWDSLPDSKRQELAKLIVIETRYFERLLDDLLFLSGLAEPRYRLSYRSFSLSDLIFEMALSMSSSKLKIEVDENVTLMGDKILIKRLIQNALNNALRFARKQVRLSLRQEEANIILEIEDDGSGFSERDLAHFGTRKFSRQWEKNENEDHLSIGLGSTIMFKIAELHQAKVVASNSSHGGGLITIYFPKKY